MPTINDLPVEILSHMFGFAVLDAKKPCGRFRRQFIDPWVSSDYQNTAPFVFLKVCGHWRAVARSTPLLWSSFNVSGYSFKNGDCYPLPLDALIHWLSLSQSAPLDLYLDHGPNDEDGSCLPPGHTNEVLQLLAQERHRWRSLSLRIDAHISQAFEDLILRQLGANAMPTFHRLEIRIITGGKTVDLTNLAMAISSVCTLKELYLTCRSIARSEYSLRGILWGQLSTIVLDVPVTVDEAAFYLAQSTTAETVTFNNLSWTAPDASYPQHTSLPYLKSLTLVGSHHSYKLLDSFDFCGLNILAIKIPSPRFPLTLPSSLKQLIDRSRCSLQDLSIVYHSAISPSDVSDFMLNPQLHKVPQVVLSCKYILEVGEDITLSSKTNARPIWAWKVTRCTQNIGWKQELDKREIMNFRIINLPT